MNKYFTIILILAIALGATSCSKKKKYHEETTTSEKSSSSSGSSSTKTFTVNGVEFKMIKVDGGTFTMGATGGMVDAAADNQFPTHKVTLSSYYIGETEVTQELWVALMDNNPSHFKGGKLPVECVTWPECQKFITKLNELTGEQFRLPTEAELEFAARGGNKSKKYNYSGGVVLDDVAWYGGNSDGHTHDIGTKHPNELGIYDMTGNVWERLQDWYGEYDPSAQNNPKGASSGLIRCTRGGGWYDYGVGYYISVRGGDGPDVRHDDMGLRLAM